MNDSCFTLVAQSKFNPIKTVTADLYEDQKTVENYGIELHCNRSNSSGNIKVSIAAYTQCEKFIFPDGCHLVSGIYHITSSKPFDATVKIQHCASSTDQLTFAKSSDENSPYEFSIVKGGDFSDTSGELKMNTFCHIAIFIKILIDWLYPVQYTLYLYYNHTRSNCSSESRKKWNLQFLACKNLRIYTDPIEDVYTKKKDNYLHRVNHVNFEFKVKSNKLDLKYKGPLIKVQSNQLYEDPFIDSSQLSIMKSDINQYTEASGHPPKCECILKNENDLKFPVTFETAGAKQDKIIYFDWPLGMFNKIAIH